jgi:hypothetical protein
MQHFFGAMKWGFKCCKVDARKRDGAANFQPINVETARLSNQRERPNPTSCTSRGSACICLAVIAAPPPLQLSCSERVFASRALLLFATLLATVFTRPRLYPQHSNEHRTPTQSCFCTPLSAFCLQTTIPPDTHRAITTVPYDSMKPYNVTILPYKPDIPTISPSTPRPAPRSPPPPCSRD